MYVRVHCYRKIIHDICTWFKCPNAKLKGREHVVFVSPKIKFVQDYDLQADCKHMTNNATPKRGFYSIPSSHVIMLQPVIVIIVTVVVLLITTVIAFFLLVVWRRNLHCCRSPPPPKLHSLDNSSSSIVALCCFLLLVPTFPLYILWQFQHCNTPSSVWPNKNELKLYQI